MIQAVVFDLGGTLIEYAGSYASWPELETPGLAAAHGYLEAQGVALPALTGFCQAAFARLPARWSAAAAGGPNLRLEAFLAELLAACGVPRLPAALLEQAAGRYEDALCAGATPIEGGAEVLASLNRAGYKLGLLSNTMFRGQAHRRDLERFGLAGYFQAMLFSADAGMWKPTAAPFLEVLARLGVAPERAAFVGDDPASDVVGGQNAGMVTVLFPSNPRFASANSARPHATIQALAQLPPLLQRL